MTSPTIDDLHDESNWLEWRARAEAVPAIAWTEMRTTEQTRAEFLLGARILRLDRMVRAGDGGSGPSPVQLAIADVLNAGAKINAINEPRRTSKTTSVQAVLLGRCALRPNYQVAWTMLTTGQSAGQRFREDIADGLQYVEHPDVPDMKVNIGKGTEHILWPGNASRLRVLTPKGASFRGAGFDAVFADEGGEADVEMSADILQGALPTMDTKQDAQFIVAGTPAVFRTGNILWEQLNNPKAAKLWHGIPETTDPEDYESWEPSAEHPRGRVRELIQAAHPGVGYTTPIEAVEDHFYTFPRDQFLREYGGLFGLEGSADTIIPPAWWDRAGVDVRIEDVPMPERFAAAIKVHHLGTYAALAVAWDYEDATDLVSEALALDGDVPRPTKKAVAVWLHQRGTDGFDRDVLVKMKRRRLVFDNYGHTAAVAKRLERMPLHPDLQPTTPKDIPLSTVGMLQALEAGTLVHFRQEVLNEAVAIAARQSFGNYGTFRFGAPKSDPEADICALEAAALALHYLDDQPRKLNPLDVLEA